jgi:hypothetical protein
VTETEGKRSEDDTAEDAPTLAWDGVELDWDGRRFRPNDALHRGELVLLCGDFRWLFALLVGRATLRSGCVRGLGASAREAVLEGRIGVSPSPVLAPAEWPVARFIELNLHMFGRHAGSVKAAAHAALDRLGLRSLADRRGHELNGAEAFAVSAAFALSTTPELVVLGAPLLLPETREFELGIIRTLLASARVALVCSRRDAELWQWATSFAYAAERPGARTTLPTELLDASRRYRVLPLGPGGLLAEALSARGARLDGSPDELPWTVTVPEDGVRLITDAALESGVALAELVALRELESVPEAR